MQYSETQYGASGVGLARNLPEEIGEEYPDEQSGLRRSGYIHRSIHFAERVDLGVARRPASNTKSRKKLAASQKAHMIPVASTLIKRR